MLALNTLSLCWLISCTAWILVPSVIITCLWLYACTLPFGSLIEGLPYCLELHHRRWQCLFSNQTALGWVTGQSCLL